MELWYDTKALRHPSLKTLVKQLRRKLPKDIIKNLFGFGYKIEIA
jgi:DNA-binding response OmpR family regulator